MPVKILMVCLGNICRSPLAEGILRSKVDPDMVYVDSAGTGGYHIGNAPDPRSIAIAKKYGLDIAHHRCRKFDVVDFNEFDLIFAMDKSNYNNVVRMAKNKSQITKVRLLLSDVDLGNDEVPDPYYDGSEAFENVYRMINIACEALVEKLKNINQ